MPKLNIDCIRDIMLTIENKPLNTTYTLEELCTNLSNQKQYSRSDIEYCCIKLEEGNLIRAYITPPPTKALNTYIIHNIHDLTFEGHSFLENIRENKNWKTIKRMADQVGSFSICVLKQIAQEIIANKIHSTLP